MKYLVNIEEILTRNVVVEAKSEEEAIIKVENLYHNEKLVLNDSDFIGKPTIKCIRNCNKLENCTKID